MILLNFSHPVTAAQIAQIEQLAGLSIARTIAALPQFDEQAPFVPQVDALLAQIDLSPAAWQTEPILVVLPSLNFICAGVAGRTARAHGLFPARGAHAAGGEQRAAPL